MSDDARFDSMGWITSATEGLKTMEPPNVGVVGPLIAGQDGERWIPFEFVHRNHWDIFNYFYPPVFNNGYGVEWLAAVYGSERTEIIEGWTMSHMHRKDGEIKSVDTGLFDEEVGKGNLMISSWLDKSNQGYSE